MDEVIRALKNSGLPFGAKAAQPQAIEAYLFHHDPKNTKILWDVRKVGLLDTLLSVLLSAQCLLIVISIPTLCNLSNLNLHILLRRCYSMR
jgi:hypothetical protein